MTRVEAIRIWRELCLPGIKTAERDGCPDYPARAESWGVFTDSMCKRGTITQKQYDTWDAPPECERKEKEEKKFDAMTRKEK